MSYLDLLKESQQIQERYLLSDHTISIDLDKFESGESRKLVIAGLSGAGKSTLGRYLAEKYKC
jgi:ABC-type proline/glycine betaine transport system ATPase subunit